MSFSPLTLRLIESLTCLPGVGPKSAQRMALHLLDRDRVGAQKLADSLQLAMEKIGRCQRCRNFSEETVCHTCRQTSRDPALLCVVETPADVIAIDQSGSFRGYYFLLLGHLSPIDGIGPEDIGADVLDERLAEGEVKELVIATGTTVEGEATAHYLSEMARRHNVVASRIAHGVPMGGELEYVDSNTLSLALQGRKIL
ncbi:recombination mediator RecR [Ketobacter alkanivorans]|uniref:Recombination protein RecR n=1 Tax=Ketobacter alkanivorans TaxID=1917421 RepID=A0A2K9LUY0_9GAMM|nr:recombination mediator RecR [Ketobacter alkanivorans]AUM14654.1 recombination protein RecR [Ketobacter alkanivorans]MCP5013795.1 recombination protein RecR [Ketobacter sp.]